ncbi:hypothetical protein HA050_20435 [Iodobacter sp. HSC-16F04]|uniref:Uncharacterized protein n=1 Tax=Iodobacter violaceini TaxID=3044271 RepID=A0ABX0KWU9_9NEIS|nr:hypothetical protein [Iodobacter violacea]NHQ88472.1 hypothetical protein [Iodobacter violacea]
MQTTLLLAAVVAAATGVIHSLMGEMLIFRHVRQGGFVPSEGAAPLRERHIRILWATWHLASVFGWAFSGILLSLALGYPASGSLILSAVMAANFGGALLVFVGTKGRHPGWIALLAVAVLAWLSANTG